MSSINQYNEGEKVGGFFAVWFVAFFQSITNYVILHLQRLKRNTEMTGD